VAAGQFVEDVRIDELTPVGGFGSGAGLLPHGSPVRPAEGGVLSGLRQLPPGGVLPFGSADGDARDTCPVISVRGGRGVRLALRMMRSPAKDCLVEHIHSRRCSVRHQHHSRGMTQMTATDYDAPRRSVVDLDEDSLEEIQRRRASVQSPMVDLDEAEEAEVFELPGADLSGEELTVSVVPMRADEFRCSRCFLVHHRSQRVIAANGQEFCRDCS
jgi:hypothetical protein